MANPTYGGVELVCGAAQETIGPRQPRVHLETMPGVDGLYFQGHGVGGRTISVAGVLTATNTTAAAAHEDLKAALRSVQSLGDGRTAAPYVGTDGAAYAHCLLTDYQPQGPSRVEDNGDGTFTASLFVKAQLQHLAD